MNLRNRVKKVLPRAVFEVIEPEGHRLEAIAANMKAGMPARYMRIIGVTGTNGKTTTCFMIHKMLVEAGYKVGLMTTVAYGVGEDITPQVAHMTSVSAPLLQKRLRAFLAAGAEWVVLETTSHALAQYRVWGVPYEIAVMTNVTHEHLDYHKTFERYRDAKKRMFSIATKHPEGFGIVNADDPSAKAFLAATSAHESYGMTEGDLKATNVQLKADGSEYTAQAGEDTYRIICHIPGEFNVYNSLAAVAVGRRMGLTAQQIEQGIAALTSVEGRMNVIDEGQAFSVVVDFAHTPDSFERLLGDLRRSTKGKLVAVFGSAGRRDESKRAIQGEIAGKYCDEVVLTEEDDRDVDGNEILEQIAEGARKSGKVDDRNLFKILDRTEAIRYGINRVRTKDDVVVLLGKGHEKTIERTDGEHPWDEIQTVRTVLRTLSR